MRNIFKVVTLLLLLMAVSCQNPKSFEISNSYTDGIYIMDPKTAREITPEKLESETQKGTAIHLQTGSSYAYEGSNMGTTDDNFNKYILDGKFTVCYVTNSVLEKTKKGSKINYETYSPGFEMKNLTGVTINIEDKEGKPEFNIILTSKKGF